MALSCVNLVNLNYISQISLSCLFLVRVVTGDILAGDSKGKREAGVILQLTGIVTDLLAHLVDVSSRQTCNFSIFLWILLSFSAPCQGAQASAQNLRQVSIGSHGVHQARAHGFQLVLAFLPLYFHLPFPTSCRVGFKTPTSDRKATALQTLLSQLPQMCKIKS